MANKINNLFLFYNAVKEEIKDDNSGEKGVFGEETFFSLILSDRIIQVKNDEINEQEYIKKWPII